MSLLRRRALLAASAAEGGKIVNTLTLKPSLSGNMQELIIEYTFEFIPTSIIKVDMDTTGLEGLAILNFLPEEGRSGVKNAVDLFCESNEIRIYEYTPAEDENYIYEVKVEY